MCRVKVFGFFPNIPVFHIYLGVEVIGEIESNFVEIIKIIECRLCTSVYLRQRSLNNLQHVVPKNLGLVPCGMSPLCSKHLLYFEMIKFFLSGKY